MPDSDQTTELTAPDGSRRRSWNTIDPAEVYDPTPIYISHRTRTLIIIGFILVFALILRNVPTIVGTVLLGATLALILSFPVRFLQRKLSRRLSILIVTLTLLGGAVLLLVLVIPLLINEITQFISALPGIMDSVMIYVRDVLNDLYERGMLRNEPEAIIEDARFGLLDSAQSLLGTALNNLVGTLSASVSVFITAFGVIFVAIYLLADIPKFHESYLRLWAPKYRPDAKVLWDTMGFSLSRYLSAQLVSLSIQGFLAFAGLWFLGVPYALVLGLVQAITAILPYIGAWLAFIPAFLVALTVSWQVAVGVGVLYLALNQIEGNLITPNLQGNAVRVHPILIFIGVIGGGQLFGIMGAILAVPTIALIRVVAEFFWLRLQVHEDKPTMLSIMRNDTASERVNSRIKTVAENDDEPVIPTLSPPMTPEN